jgi:uncharacterized protein (TIGR02284 family)
MSGSRSETFAYAAEPSSRLGTGACGIRSRTWRVASRFFAICIQEQQWIASVDATPTGRVRIRLRRWQLLQEGRLDADILDHLKSLHTSAIDARNGYQEALKDAEGRGLTPLFADMIALHESHAAELARELTKANEIPDDKGSFMTLVHKTIMDVRSLFNGLDESVLPGLIDGEKRNVSKYDDVLNEAKPPADVADLLTAQRTAIAQKIAQMETRKAAYDNRAS